MAGRESPVDIFNTFIDTNKTSLASVMAPPPVGGVTNIAANVKEEYKSVYSPEFILDVLNEGFYVNENINHLIYYFIDPSQLLYLPSRPPQPAATPSWPQKPLKLGQLWFRHTCQASMAFCGRLGVALAGLAG